MRIVVTGGAGALGSRVVAEAAGRGHEGVAASRRTGLDLATGAGLDRALHEADAVVHCADNLAKGRSVTVDGTRRLALGVSAMATPAHLVYVSIVGCDLSPLPYYRNKSAAEELIRSVSTSATVLRSTQFHSLAAYFARTLSAGPLTFAIGDMALQPVDIDWVAARLVDLATGPAPTAYTRAEDVAGPEVLALGQLAALVRAHAAKPAPRVVRLPPLGRLMRSFSDRTNVPAPGTADVGGRPFRQWLHQQPRVLRGR